MTNIGSQMFRRAVHDVGAMWDHPAFRRHPLSVETVTLTGVFEEEGLVSRSRRQVRNALAAPAERDLLAEIG